MSKQATLQSFFAAKPSPKRVASEAAQAPSPKRLATQPVAVLGKDSTDAPQSVPEASVPSTSSTLTNTTSAPSAAAKPVLQSGAVAPAAASTQPSAQQQSVLQALLTDEGWKSALKNEFRKPYFQRLETFLKAEWKQHQVYPVRDHIFRAMNTCPLDNVKVVILGQDPYHNVGQAMGLSFSVPRGQPVPSSLKNIYTELRTDCQCTPPTHGDLQQWADQGVLLLNTSLTVRAHQANSHAKKGWEDFTDAAIKALSTNRKGLVFLLWGRNAQQKAAKGVIDKGRHHVLMSAHPSGLSANKGFFGCKHFSQANTFLQKEGLQPINWQLA
ncbi:hypothetical protein WJX73_000220 [Symbiochloris irregularis]|uniref:Uracil-DNA glycosylase n=1 Tax=Symbiochloris irregularis TaxID=706552 RepID=A0AAW1PJ02_9CHLO